MSSRYQMPSYSRFELNNMIRVDRMKLGRESENEEFQKNQQRERQTDFDGGPGRIRTDNQRIMSPLLHR